RIASTRRTRSINNIALPGKSLTRRLRPNADLLGSEPDRIEGDLVLPVQVRRNFGVRIISELQPTPLEAAPVHGLVGQGFVRRFRASVELFYLFVFIRACQP